MSNWPDAVESMPTSIDAQDFLSKAGIQHHTMHMQSHRIINSLQQVVGTGWGDPTASGFQTVRDRILAVEAVIPVGTVLTYAGATAPSGWQLCDGSTHTSAALKLLLNAAAGKTSTDSFGSKTPDLRARFVVGASNTGSSLASGLSTRAVHASVGGAETVGLTVNDIPSHTHTATAANSSVAHTHNVTGSTTPGGGHNHGGRTGDTTVQSLVAWSASQDVGAGSKWRIYDPVRGENHSHSIPAEPAHTHSLTGAVTSDVSSTSHTHTVTVDAAGNGSSPAHNNLPPFYVMSYIIRL